MCPFLITSLVICQLTYRCAIKKSDNTKLTYLIVLQENLFDQAWIFTTGYYCASFCWTKALCSETNWSNVNSSGLDCTYHSPRTLLVTNWNWGENREVVSNCLRLHSLKRDSTIMNETLWTAYGWTWQQKSERWLQF